MKKLHLDQKHPYHISTSVELVLSVEYIQYMHRLTMCMYNASSLGKMSFYNLRHTSCIYIYIYIPLRSI